MRFFNCQLEILNIALSLHHCGCFSANHTSLRILLILAKIMFYAQSLIDTF